MKVTLKNNLSVLLIEEPIERFEHWFYIETNFVITTEFSNAIKSLEHVDFVTFTSHYKFLVVSTKAVDRAYMQEKIIDCVEKYFSRK